MGMKSDGTIVSTACLYPDWNKGQCGIDKNWVDIIQPHGCTGQDSLGLKSDGTVIGIGRNHEGMLNVQDWDLIGNSATLVLEPDSAAPVIGDTLCIDVNVQDVSGLYAAAFDLVYDPAVLSYESASEGNLLNADSGATFFNASLLNNDPANGTLVTGVSRVADIGTVSGSGTIATACFAVMGGSGSGTSVSLDNAYFEGADQGSVVDLTPGENPTIPVEIGIPQNLVVSDSGTLGQLNLSWDAAPDASGYEIYRADASGGEFTLLGTSTGTGYEDANCILTSVSYVYKLKAISASGTTTGEYSGEASGTAAGLAGDINRDNRVDGRDLSILARAFNTTENDADYQCLANLDRTGTIDGDDLVILTASFGSQL
ncbi:MAG: cohesin domain-containing protein [Desulfobacter sp.]